MLRSQHVEATRRAVLAAARSSFGRKGYTQTSIDEIAAAARVTKGAVYHHFAGKKALFRAVYSEVEAEAQARRRHGGRQRHGRRTAPAVLLIWGESCDFFPMAHARRLASDFPRATLVSVPGAKTWVPVDNPAVVADAIGTLVPAPVP